MIETTSAHVNIYASAETGFAELLANLQEKGKGQKSATRLDIKKGIPQSDMTQEQREKLKGDTCYAKDAIYNYEAVDFIVKKIIDETGLEAGRSATHHTALKFIVSNAFDSIRFGLLGFRISTSPNNWGYSLVGTKPVMKVLGILVDNGYLVKNSGCKASLYDKNSGAHKLKNYLTAFTLTPKFRKFFKSVYYEGFRVAAEHYIHVKDQNKSFLDRDEVLKIKDRIKGFDSSNETLRVLDDNLAKGLVTYKGFRRREFGYHLQYHMNDHGEVIGGRIYAMTQIQNLSQTDRLKNIRIEGEPVVELDFGNTHPRIIATLEGVKGEIPDPYQIGLDLYRRNNDCAEEAKERLSAEATRKILKTILFILLYAKKDKLHTAVISVLNANSIEASKDIANNIIEAIKARNPYLEKYIGANAWGLLQGIDGQIAMNVIGQFIGKSELLLPYHDSFIVKESKMKDLQKAMATAWNDVLGNVDHCRIDKKEPDLEGFDVVYGEDCLNDFDEAMLFA